MIDVYNVVLMIVDDGLSYGDCFFYVLDLILGIFGIDFVFVVFL